jgi:RNA-directed DNA polymerase
MRLSVNVGEWEEVRGRLNQILRGWSAYFSYGSRATAYREVNNYVSDRVRHFLKRRHKVQSRKAPSTMAISGSLASSKYFGLARPRELREPCGEVHRKAGCSKRARPV